MNLDLNGYRLHLVFSPTDMRSGYRTLSAIASSCLQLDVAEGKDCVVFVSARQTKRGSCVLSNLGYGRGYARWSWLLQPRKTPAKWIVIH